MKVLEIIYRWPDGREDVHYRFPVGSLRALQHVSRIIQLRKQAAAGGWRCPYRVRKADR